ncbi:MAG: EAL domain-containing protein [Terracidiphilus sp.]
MEQANFRIRLLGRPQVVRVNGGVERLLGYAPDQFLCGEVTLAERTHAQDAEIAARIFSAHPEPNGVPKVAWENLRVRHADGRIRCMRAETRRERGDDGTPVLHLTLEDMRLAEQCRGGSSLPAHLHALMESTDGLVYFKDRHHVLVAMNEKVRLAVEDLIGPCEAERRLTDYDLFPEEIADIYYQMERDIFAGKPLVHEIQKSVDRDGCEIWVDNRKYPVRDESGSVIGLLGVARQVMDPVATATQRENAAQLREAQCIAGLGSYALDVNTGLWTASEALEEILGIDRRYPRTFEGWSQLVHPEDREPTLACYRSEVLGKLQPFRRAYRIERPQDGVERWVHARGELELDAEGRPVVMRGTIQDVTELKQAEAAIRESRELMRQFIDHAPVALAMLDREMRYLAFSGRWLEMFDLDPTNLPGRLHYDVLPGIPEEWREAHRRALEGEVMASRADRLVRPDGRTLVIRREVRPWREGSGEVGGIILCAEDITQQKLAEDRLHLAASVFTHAAEGIVITDAEGTILDVNDAFTRITGYSREEAIGKNPRILKSKRQSKEFYEDMWRQLKEKGKWTGEIWNTAKSGRIFPEMLTISAVPDASGQTMQYVAMFSDLTSMKEQEWKLERIAHYDLLTGLPNRVLLADRKRQAMAQASRRGLMMALICLDLDDFKAVNDRHGHNVGDQLLVAAAQRLKGVLRQGDTLARPGGDEFVALLPDLGSAQDALPILARLQAAARSPFDVGSHTVQVSASAGVAFYPQPVDVDADQLLRQASQALYHAKLEGKDRYHIFDLRQDENVRGHHEDLERIRTALKTEELVLHYQPRVNMRTGKLLGVEALIRWQHPEVGLLQPAQFLPVVEGNPLEIEIGEWVIETALRQVEAWNREGLDLGVSVNVSAQQLQQRDFEDRLRRHLAAHPTVKANRLELELLENGALTEMAAAVELIEICRKMGVAFALDDFGTGYSSLSYLRRLPFDVLKIDRAFVRDMLDDPEDLTLLEGVLGLASAFRRQAVAEGVESVEHGLMLLRLGCEQGQGYGIARPMPANEMAAWARAWRPHPEWLRARTLSPSDWPLLRAGVEHRAWVAAIGEYVSGCRQTLPEMKETECQFGRWLAGAMQAEHGSGQDLKPVAALHGRIHQLGAEVVSLKERGRQDEAAAALANLQALRDEMLESLHLVVQ